MKNYKVTYRVKGIDDIASVWVKAINATKAEDYVIDEYWDVDEIISCSVIN